MNHPNPPRFQGPRRERGVALVVALILLVVATLIGLAASRGTILQERMASNSFDRGLAFQRSEAALRAAEVALRSEWRISVLGGPDCSLAVVCRIVPIGTFTATGVNWTNVGAPFDVNDARTPGIPQYHIAFMGTGQAENSMGTRENAESTNYGAGAAPDNVAFYRVTARSSDPTLLAGRSIVVLQTTVRRPL